MTRLLNTPSSAAAKTRLLPRGSTSRRAVGAEHLRYTTRFLRRCRCGGDGCAEYCSGYCDRPQTSLHHRLPRSAIRPAPANAGPVRRPLFVQPQIFEAPAVVLAVDHDRQPFQLGLPAGRGAEVVDDRPGSILLQLLVDLPDELPALALVGFDRLLLEPLLELGVAIAGIVALGVAAVVLVELLVRVVDAAAGVVQADLVILAGDLGKPVGRLDRVERAVDISLLELVDQDDGRISVGWDVACRNHQLEPIVRPVAERLHDLPGQRSEEHTS